MSVERKEGLEPPRSQAELGHSATTADDSHDERMRTAEPVGTSNDTIFEKAAEMRLVWARVKGYPAWPAQVMDEQAAKKWLKGVPPGKHKTLPLMFFGTFEICWSAVSAVDSWQAGIEKGYGQRQKKDKRLLPSIEQATQFLNGTVHPQWWWQPETQEECPTDQHQQITGEVAAEIDRPSGKVLKKRRLEIQPREKQAAGLGAQAYSGTLSSCAAPAVGSGVGDQQASLRAAQLAPTPRRASSGATKVSSVPGGQAPLELSEGAALPRYDFTRRNVWPPNLSRPKRNPKDDISVCDCRPAQPSADDPAAGTSVLEAARLPEYSLMALAWGRSTRARATIAHEQGKADCGPDCVNRQSFIHCDAKTCPCGAQCTNKPFYSLPMPRMTVFHTGDRGWGVRAEESITGGTFIVEYTGELLDKAEKQRRLEEQARDGVHDFYMMEHSPGIIIDARLRGNLARLINSSCDPNCETQKWRDAATNEVRIGIFAKRDIQPGEELAYDYNFEHSGLAHQAGAYRCRCGAAKCRGTMDTQPDRLKDAYRRIEVFWDGDQRYYRGTVLGFQAAKGVHVVQYDDGQRLKEDLQVVPHRWLPDDAVQSAEGKVADSHPEWPVLHPSPTETSGDPAPAKRQRLDACFPVPGAPEEELIAGSDAEHSDDTEPAQKPDVPSRLQLQRGQSVLMSILQHHAAAGKAGTTRHHRPAAPSKPETTDVCRKGRAGDRMFRQQDQATGLEADGGAAGRLSFKRSSAEEEQAEKECHIGPARSTSPAHQCGSCGESLTHRLRARHASPAADTQPMIYQGERVQLVLLYPSSGTGHIRVSLECVPW